MALQVVNTASCVCTMGAAPSTLVVLPTNKVMVSNQPAANIVDNIPMTNIMPFGVCSSLAFPATASATAAALGVLTPMPCVPLTPAPWSPGSPPVIIGNMPALNNSSTLTCVWGGTISITAPGQGIDTIP